jgi:hypothetical protein
MLLGVAALLRRRVWLVLLVTLAVVGLAAYKASRDATWYRATAVVRLSNERRALSGRLGEDVAAPVGGWQTDERLSEIQVLRSRAVASEVAAAQGLRLQVRSRGFPAGVLQDVRVAPDARVDTLRLAFSTAGVSAQGTRRRARAAYGAPLELDGVRFTIPTHPGVASALLAVVTADVCRARCTARCATRPTSSTCRTRPPTRSWRSASRTGRSTPSAPRARARCSSAPCGGASSSSSSWARWRRCWRRRSSP